MIRTDREDTTRQREALDDARRELASALDELAAEAKAGGRAARSKTGEPDETLIDGAIARYRRAVEARDIARMDLAGASGEHL